VSAYGPTSLGTSKTVFAGEIPRFTVDEATSDDWNPMMAPFAHSLSSSRCHGRKARRSHVKPEAREEICQRAVLMLHAL
jgi:hypothetical protein